MIQEGSKVYVPFRLIDETDNAGNVGRVIAVSGSGYEGNDVEGSEPAPRIFSVKFKDGSEEGFHFEDLEEYRTFRYLREWWTNGGKEKFQNWTAGIAVILILSLITWVALLPKPVKKVEPKQIDRVEQLGELKASLEVKKGAELADQRDLKRKIEASIQKVTGYDKLIGEYTTEQLNLVNGK